MIESFVFLVAVGGLSFAVYLRLAIEAWRWVKPRAARALRVVWPALLVLAAAAWASDPGVAIIGIALGSALVVFEVVSPRPSPVLPEPTVEAETSGAYAARQWPEVFAHYTGEGCSL